MQRGDGREGGATPVDSFWGADDARREEARLGGQVGRVLALAEPVVVGERAVGLGLGDVQRDADGGAERLRVLNEFRDLRSQTWGELTASWRTSDTSLSTFGDSRSQSSSSCRRLFLCAGTDSVPSLQRDRDECIVLTDRSYLLSRLI